ncbi:PREDICTED: cyclin-J18 [Prunus dulcis]|uniref:B-like cyclin n=1 Tax=Prunus dulcis TaxID=3755 RepID=A0A5E4EGR6_PRUDU|nr:cyclin-J18 isoform X1 [Prunus dulcis]VVA14642.1 PREDICTED: cyclin-J18 [Prunus dulcis]
MQRGCASSALPLRARLIDFLIQSAHKLQVAPTVKYTALSIFAHRFYPRCLSRLEEQGNDVENWLLQPLRESNLQLFALVSLWISTKIHTSPCLSVKIFKSLGDNIIKEQHYTIRDYLEAEVVLMQVVNFEIGMNNSAFVYFEELLLQFKGVAKVGELVNFEAGMDIMDLIYEKEETSMLYTNPHSLAASILVASYVITVPKQTWEFPVVPWVKFVTGCEEEDILDIVRDILKHVLDVSC